MKIYLWTFLALAALFLISGCGGNNVGALFPPYGKKGDAKQSGWIENDDGSFKCFAAEAGARYANGPPEIVVVYPAAGDQEVDVNTFIVVRFTETLNPDETKLEKGLTLVKSNDNEKVDGDYSFAPGSAGTVLVFEPDDPLEDEELYDIILNGKIEDAQGVPFEPDEGEQEAVFSFFTGKDGDDIEFGLIDSLTLPSDGETDNSDGASLLLFFTEAVDTTDGAAGLGVNSDNFGVTDGKKNDILGTHSFAYGGRLFIFTPSSPYISGERITAEMKAEVANEDGTETLSADITKQFDVVGFPHVTEITFTNNDPLLALPAHAYAGRINKGTDQDLFEIEITLTGQATAAVLTTIFWDNDNKAVLDVINTPLSEKEHKFTIDLRPEDEDLLKDGTITVGAYTTQGDVNSPLGPPLILRDLLKDLVEPSLVSLGPPNDAQPGALDFLTESASPAIHGRASEDLSNVAIAGNFLTFPIQVDGITFFSIQYPPGSGKFSQEVTRGADHLFITEIDPALDLSTGGWIPPGMAGRGTPPVTFTDITLTDLAGNTGTYINPVGATMDFRGFFFSLVAAPSLELLFYDSRTLRPLEGAEVWVEDRTGPDTDNWGATTNVDGEVVITFSPGTPPALNDHVILTAVKGGYRVFSFEWINLDRRILASLPLTEENEAPQESNVTLLVTKPDTTFPDVYFGGNALRTGTEAVLQGPENNPVSATLTVDRNKLQFVEAIALEDGASARYQWGWSNPFVPDGATDGQAVLFTQGLIDPVMQEIQVLSFSTVFGAAAARQARLMAALPGFTGVLPLGVDPSEVDLTGGSYRFDVPIPPSLAVDEVFTDPEQPAFDPPCELIIEPDLGPAAFPPLTPNQTLFGDYLSYEVEEIGTNSPPSIIRGRLAYLQSNLGGAVVPVVDFPSTEIVALSPNPPDTQWTNVLSGASGGAYLLHLRTLDTTRHWTVYLSLPAAGAGADVDFTFPDLTTYGLPAFNTTGTSDCPFFVEAFSIDTFALTNTFLSEIQRNWKSYWRSNQITVTK